MAKTRPYLAQFLVGFDADSDIHADKTAEYLEARLEEHLDEDDTVRIAQIVCVGEPLVQEEVVTRLQLARNELIRLNYRDTMGLAQEVDKVIWALLKQAADDEATVNDYDYNRVVDIAEAFKRGENPLV